MIGTSRKAGFQPNYLWAVESIESNECGLPSYQSQKGPDLKVSSSSRALYSEWYSSLWETEKSSQESYFQWSSLMNE